MAARAVPPGAEAKEVVSRLGGGAAFEDVQTEAARRRQTAQQISALPPPDPEAMQAYMDQRFQAWLAGHSGYFVVVLYNHGFSNRYMVPGLQVLRFFRATSPDPRHMTDAQAAAEAFVRRLNADPAVRFKPAVVPANTPFLLAYSEAAALSAGHVGPKRLRAMERQGKFNQYRDALHALRKHFADQEEVKTDPGAAAEVGALLSALETGVDMWAWYHAQPKHFDLRRADEETAAALPACTVLREAHRRGRAVYDRLDGAGIKDLLSKVIRAPGRDGDAVPCLDDDDDDGGGGGGRTLETGGVPAAAAAAAATAAPPAIIAAAGSKWSQESAAGDDLSYFPAAYHAPESDFVAASYLPDWDLPADSPEFPEAAGMEMPAILWGGLYSGPTEAQAAVDTLISEFARGFDTFVHVAKLPVFPSEAMRAAGITEKHKAAHPAMSDVLNQVMHARDTDVTRAQTAKEVNEAGLGRIPVTEVGGEDGSGGPPELGSGSCSAEREPAMRVLSSFTWSTPAAAPAAAASSGPQDLPE